ncbi:MAG: CheR family methyltransferase [Spirochaetaceae bacterium]
MGNGTETASTSLGRTIASQNGDEQQSEQIDYKMVTFSLGGKDYGIDIMQVKEIAKFFQFTYVPNSPPFVRGVYNLRGDIISIVDLRLLFNLPVQRKPEGSAENGLILRVENNHIGVIVDQIDKVVGIQSDSIQPPHPIFGDINIKFISGVVENEGRLYIILDVERIFRKEDEEEKSLSERTGFMRGSGVKKAREPETTRYEGPPERDETSAAYAFICETLETFIGFHVTRLNERWVGERFQEWLQSRAAQGRELQLRSREEAEEFLAPFYSRFTGQLWPGEYLDEVARAVPLNPGSVIQVWNPGCGEGAESFSLTVLLREQYPEKQVKVWASDNDLLGISNAANTIYDRDRVPERYEPYIVDGTNGPTFSSDIKNSILFEYSDLTNATGLPAMDLIVARDVLSFFDEKSQERVLEAMIETLKPDGYLILGEREEPLAQERWEVVGEGSVRAYRKRL